MQDKELVRSKLQHLEHHAHKILEEMKLESTSSNTTEQSASTQARMTIQESIQQRILSAQSALDKITKHLDSGDEPSVREYEVCIYNSA